MPNSRIEIKSTDGIYTDVFIDGHQIHGIRSMRFEKKAHDMPILTLDLNALDISVDSPMVLKQDGMREEIKIYFTEGNYTI